MKLLLLLLLISSTLYSQTGGSYFISQQDSSSWYRRTSNNPSDNINDTIYHLGFVGVGTNIPQYALDVKGTMNISDSIIYTKIQNGNNVEAINVAHYSSNAPITGALHIHTNIVTGSNTMIDFDIEGYNYSSEGSWSGKIGLYTYGGTNWFNMSNTGNRNLSVYAYNNAGKVSIIIGDSLQSWSYPRITITRARTSNTGATASQMQNWSMQIINKLVNTTNYTNLSSLFGGGIAQKFSTNSASSNLDTIAGLNGVEFLADNKTQGVGISYNGIYRTGTNVNQDFYFRNKGNGSYYFQFIDGSANSFFYRQHRTTIPNSVIYNRCLFGNNQREYTRITNNVDDTLSSFFKSSMYFGVINGAGALSNAMRIRTSQITTTQTPYLDMGQSAQNRKIVLYDGNVTSDHSYYGFGINPSTLRYQVSNGAYHRFCVATSTTTSDTVVSIGNRSIGLNINTPTSNLDINGSIAQSYRVITATSTLLTTDNIVYVKNGATNITITLPLVDRRIYTIVRFDNTSTGTITIKLSGGTIQSAGGTVGATTTLSNLANQRVERFQITGTVARRLTNN